MAPKKKLSGGSPASANVVRFVTPATFDKLALDFTNKVVLTGGTNTSTSKLHKMPVIDMNETASQRLMVYNKSSSSAVGGAKAKRGAAAPKKQRGGNVFDNIVNTYTSTVNSTMPPPAIAKGAHAAVDMSVVSPSQLSMSTENITGAAPLIKSTAFPANDTYAGPFAFGGAKPKKAAKKPAAAAKKPATKKTKAAK